jgi:peroxiredoxin Q/BCP
MIFRKAQWPVVLTLAVLGPALGLTFGLYGDSLLCSGGCPIETSESSPETKTTSPESTEPLELRVPDGGDVALDELAPGRRAVLVVMKGTWCTVCRKQLERLSDRLAEIRQRGGAIFGVSDASPSKNRALMRELDLGFPVLSDADRDVLRELGFWQSDDCHGHVTPGLVFLNVDGDVAKRHLGRYPGQLQEAFVLETLCQMDD